MRKGNLAALSCLLFVLLLQSPTNSARGQQGTVYRGVTVEASYAYHMAGGKNWVHGFAIKIDNPQSLSKPGLVFLASGIERAGQAILKVNGRDYAVPPQDVDFSGRARAPEEQEGGGKASFYADERGGADVISKIVVVLKPEDLKTGINEVEFLKSGDQGYEITGAQIQSVSQTESTVVAQTYHLLARGRPATISDFDKITEH